MQTFLPYPSFIESAKVLDRARLGKQRVETWQLLNIEPTGEKVGWRNHPAYKMWRNNLGALCVYGIAVCNEWIDRGYKDTLRDRFTRLLNRYDDFALPQWFSNLNFHESHKSNLLRKGRERLEKTGKSDILNHYRSLWPDVPDNLPYIWPV